MNLMFDKPLTLHLFPVGQLRCLDSLFTQELKASCPCFNRFGLYCWARISLIGFYHHGIRVGNLRTAPSTNEMLSLAPPLVIKFWKRLESLFSTVSLNDVRFLLPFLIDLSDGGAYYLCDDGRILVLGVNVLAMGSCLTALTPGWEFASRARLNQYILSEFFSYSCELGGVILDQINILLPFIFSRFFSEVGWLMHVFRLNCAKNH